uniref:Cytochrome c oxidase subunit 8 n=1 Tax=Rhinolophus ferrumequinum TaxID=59479 RepID=A0A671E5U7_RHIFE
MPQLAPAIRLLQAPLRGWVVPRAYISAKPAKTPTSASVSTSQAAGVGFLIPAGWVLSHLESYKKSAA